MKKILSFFLALILTFSGLVPIYASGQYEEAGNILKDLKLLSGNEKGDLMLDGNLKRQHMVVMIARLFNEFEIAKNFDGPNKFKDLTSKHRQDIPYISWANSKGFISGYTDGTFGFDRDVTVQEYQSVLLRALGYTESWDRVPQSAKDRGIMDELSLNNSSKLTRGQMAAMTVNSLRQLKNGKNITLAQELGVTIPDKFMVDATVKVENNTLLFEGQAKGTDFLILNLKPAPSNTSFTEKSLSIPIDGEGKFSYKVDNLPVGNYLYGFQSGANSTALKSISIEVLPFNLASVKADNLKEITLTYTQPIDKATASLVNNYVTTAGSIKDVRFEENNTKIILTLNGLMTQRMKYKISALKIKSASGEERPLKDYEFEAFDNQIPSISSVKPLGTKGLRVYLSEPVKNVIQTNFKIDSKNFSGTISVEHNVITILYYSNYTLSVGNHTLTVSGLEDYAGNKIADQNIPFIISNDITPPSIKGATATFDEVIIEFDDDINPTSAVVNNFYWKQGSIKRFANNVTFVENRAIVKFTNNNLLNGENTIYIENIVDYSNNRMKATEIKVTPIIDTSTPEVINYIISEDGKTITVYYSKNVIGNMRNNYSIIDKNNRTVNIRDIQGSDREYRIHLYAPLPVGLNVFTIQGIQDTTPLKNILIPFSATIDMKDVEKPRILNHSGYANHIIINFSKQMNISTITNTYNYIITFGGKQYRLPNDTLFTPNNDGKSVSILLPEYFDGKKVMVGTAGNLTSLDIIGLKDINDNDIEPLMINITFDGSISGKAKAVDYYSEKPGRQGLLIDSNIIKIRFNAPIIQANVNDFVVGGRIIYNVVADNSDVVTIYLSDNDINYYIPMGSIFILPNNSMKTSIDTGVEGGTIQLFDEVPPRIRNNTYNLTVYGNQIELPFTEVLEEEGATLYRRDLEVVRLADNKILSKDDYTTSLKSSDKSILVITINNRSIASSYSIRLSGEFGSGTLSYIRDKDGNLALPSDVYFTGTDIPKQ